MLFKKFNFDNHIYEHSSNLLFFNEHLISGELLIELWFEVRVGVSWFGRRLVSTGLVLMVDYGWASGGGAARYGAGGGRQGV
jgi:hypothetical protein